MSFRDEIRIASILGEPKVARKLGGGGGEVSVPKNCWGLKRIHLGKKFFFR